MTPYSWAQLVGAISMTFSIFVDQVSHTDDEEISLYTPSPLMVIHRCFIFNESLCLQLNCPLRQATRFSTPKLHFLVMPHRNSSTQHVQGGLLGKNLSCAAHKIEYIKDRVQLQKASCSIARILLASWSAAF